MTEVRPGAGPRSDRSPAAGPGSARPARPDRPEDRRGQRHRRAALVLAVLTPLVAELALGSTPIRMAWLVLLWVPVYGAGVLFVREAVVRRGRGWPSILVLAVAYELLEDGLGLQALTSPHLYDAAGWGLRVAGFNAPYWLTNVVYHAVFTLVVPIALTGLVFPRHRGRPYLGRTGLVVSGLVALLGVAVLRVSVPPVEDPGYQAPAGFVLGCVAAVVLLGVLALVVLPPARPRTASVPVPSRAALVSGAGVATLCFVLLSFPLGDATQPAFTHGAWVVLPMVGVVVLASAAYVSLRRWSAAPGWSDRHALATLGGALVGHTVGGLVALADTVVDRVGLLVVVVLTVLGVTLLDRCLAVREHATSAAAGPFETS
ncbi:hypothetical protein [Phycicoccus sp.]|uniref:hypothetical protein n=1 Tax=Phycicoccus sp. TaxID=1902410 RepID=UPI002B9E5437|nr:hypothetical protein [Phycicoccus sp.]HMM96823.1 hypothetical protein [Phycicoccus sp.]